MGLELLPLCFLCLLPPTLPRSRAARCPRWHGDERRGSSSSPCECCPLTQHRSSKSRQERAGPAPQTFCSIRKINSIYAAPWQVLNPRCFMPVPEPPRYPSLRGSAPRR